MCGDEEVDMELAMWSGWTLLLVWYLNALRGDIRGGSGAEELAARVDIANLSAASRQT